ncbi:MAG: hypothetical protein KGS72_19750 [Cyanobacteria bacterium REEB67]|nr:hypothetical protein [Cyanobacteria bacterium REEB67]
MKTGDSKLSSQAALTTTAATLLIVLAAAIFFLKPGAGRLSSKSLRAQAAAPVQYKPDKLTVGGSSIKVEFGPGPLALPRSSVIDWIQRSANSVSHYYGHFPTERATIRVMPFYGRGTGFATTDSEDDHGLIIIPVGHNTTEVQLQRDWVLTHEMVHLAFPLVYPKHRWLAEGMATYIEPIARLQAGYLPPEKMWGDLVDELPKGLPEDGDHGLNDTGSWGRTYWGGALFCFLADLKIRKETGDKKGLQQALQKIDSTEGDITSDLEVEDALKLGDKGIGPNSKILENLYLTMKDKPVTPDLTKIWQELGIKRVDGKIAFDDKAPLAKTRKAIEAGI